MRMMQNKKRKTSIMKWVIVSTIVFTSILLSISLLLFYPFPSSNKEAYFIGEHPLLFQGKQVGNAIVENDIVYVPLSFMEEHLDDSVFYDKKTDAMIITTVNKVIYMPTESLTYYVNEKPVELHLPALKTKDDELFIALSLLLDYYPIDFTILPELEVVWIQMDGEELHNGRVLDQKIKESQLKLRVEPTVTSPYFTEVKQLDRVYIESETDDYYYVRKLNGIAGFIKKEWIEKGTVEKVVVDYKPVQQIKRKLTEPIQLTWEAVYTKNPSVQNIPQMDGVNVVSPTWFELIDEKGIVKNLGSIEYVHWAKARGYEVWGLFSNGFNPDLTHAAFKDFETRQTIIRQLLHYSKMYQLDGINIDIENVNETDGPLVTQFMREATPYFHEAGLTVSMDITFIASGNWSAFYEREKLAKIVDYLIVMAYDEHWGSSPRAGSVASIPWVTSNLERLLEIIPNDQLILGVPLYTRLWKEEQVDGEIKVSSQALSMEKVQEWMAERNVTPTYDNATGQNYLEYDDEVDKCTYKIWLEDEMSIKNRVQIAIDYDLAGIASWARYFADEQAWIALNEISQKKLSKK